MNIVISLECSPEQAESILTGIKDILSAQDLETTSYELVGTTVLQGLPKMAVDQLPELPPEPMGDPVGVPPVEQDVPSISVSPTGIVAMVNVPAMEPPAADPVESDPIVPPAPTSFGDVRVLTLSTSFSIPSTVVPAANNTVLRVLGLTANEGIVRFSYNGFEHALPVANAEVSIANNTHTNGPATVRLVIDIAGKIYPCLVDIEGGETEELLIGDDLLPAIEETAENVPTE